MSSTADNATPGPLTIHGAPSLTSRLRRLSPKVVSHELFTQSTLATATGITALYCLFQDSDSLNAFDLIGVLVPILIILVGGVTGYAFRSTRALRSVLRFAQPGVTVVTSVTETKHWKTKDVPPGDRNAAQRLIGLLTSAGYSGEASGCHLYNEDWLRQNSTVLVCGPALNTLARPINAALASSQWYLGPWFVDNSQKGAEAAEGVVPPEANWSLYDGLTGHIAATGGVPTVADGASQRVGYGLLYVGKNPLNRTRWLIWVAGLEAEATPGAAIALTSSSFVNAAAAKFESGDDYCAALVRYRYLGEEPYSGEASHSLTSGRVA